MRYRTQFFSGVRQCGIGRRPLAAPRWRQLRSQGGVRGKRLVELRFYAGLELTEISALTGRSERSLKRDWRRDRAFFYREMSGEALPEAGLPRRRAQSRACAGAADRLRARRRVPRAIRQRSGLRRHQKRAA